MPGEELKIVTTEDAHTPRTIPYAHMGQTKEELELLESQGIISKQTEPTDWCAPIVVARKKTSDRIRLCVDFSPALSSVNDSNQHLLQSQWLTLLSAKPSISLSWMHSKVITNAHWTKIANFSQPSSRLLVGTSSCVPHLAFHRSVRTMTGGCTRPFKISLTSAV